LKFYDVCPGKFGPINVDVRESPALSHATTIEVPRRTREIG